MEEIDDMLSRCYEGQEGGKSGRYPTPFQAFGPGIGLPERSLFGGMLSLWRRQGQAGLNSWVSLCPSLKP